jgi:acyl transferase domain-containing protein/surfactin synthase thioesterase subunit
VRRPRSDAGKPTLATPHPWDIGIIGMACRFPGAANARTFWNNLVRGVESVTFFSEAELLAAGEDPDLVRHPHYVKAAPILEAHDEFDAGFFGYSPREARLMDPQHRLFLEVAWEAFEDAGYDPLGAKGNVGVYAGAGGLVTSYMVRLGHPDLRGQTGDLGHIGNDRDFLCSRVSFRLDLTGPSVNVQSACSTSVLAVHLACRGLLDGEADMALAGASVVRVPHRRGYLAEPGNIYSRDGHCRAFDAKASGTLFGSGVAALLLKPLATALADGDHVWAVIKGAAINNDGGHKLSYTASTATGQARAAARALAIANAGADSLGYVECHGTATALGDPLEIQALTQAFRAHTQRAGFCPIGSVKSNVGHLEQCAGMAGLIKTVLTLKHGVIPPSLHFETPNPRIPLDRSPFFVNTALRPFGETRGRRRAGVNSVGMGGTNGFIIVEEAPPPRPRTGDTRPVLILNVSAQTEGALVAQVSRLRDALASPDAAEASDACFTINRGRHHFDCRISAVGRDQAELRAELDRFLGAPPGPVRAKARGRRESIAFLFSGQGTQFARMGEAISRAEPSFRETLEQCFAMFAAAGIPLADVVFDDDDDRLHRTLYAQPALFSLQVALTELWRGWGISPDTVIGHSVGEFAAAVAAGVCSLPDAVRLVAVRAQAMEALSERGGMVSVGADLDTIKNAWPAGRADLAVAALNAPDRVVVSGSVAALTALADALRPRSVPVTNINASHAFHSPLMDPMLETFEATARTVAFAPPRLRWISTLTGREMVGAPDARYWRDQIRCEVRFNAALETAVPSTAVFLEVGPGATLINLGRRCVKHLEAARGDAVGWLCSLTQEGGDWRSLLEAVRQLYLRGHSIRWDALEPAGGRRVSLPTYPFQRRRWWLESTPDKGAGAPPPDLTRHDTPHPFLGERPDEGLRFETRLDVHRLPFLSDHRVFGRVVLPTTVVLEAVSSAAVKFLGFTRPMISDLLYEHALSLPTDRPIAVHLVFEEHGGRSAFRLESTAGEGDPWHLHVSGTVQNAPDAPDPPPFPSHALRAGPRDVPPDRFYRFLSARGLSYGPAFQGIVGLWRHDDEAFAKVALPPSLAGQSYLLHPAFLDACLHVYAALVRKYRLFDDEGMTETRTYVPIGMESFQLYRAGVGTGWVHAMVVARNGDDEPRLKVDIRAYGDDGRPVALFRGVTIRETSEERPAGPEDTRLEPLLYRVAWREAPLPETSVALSKHWCLFGDGEGGVGEHLAALLQAEGCAATVLTPESAPWPAELAEPSHLDALLPRAPDETFGLVYLWGLRTPPVTLAESRPAVATHPHAGTACIGLLKALERRRDGGQGLPRLWLVTRGAQSPESDQNAAPEIGQSPLWGLGRTVALEYPELWGGLIDLPPHADVETAAQLLLRELKRGVGEDQIVLREGRRLAARFVRGAPWKLPPRRRLTADATYWIVGGLGAVGLKTAEVLVDAGARHLLLTGRQASEGDVPVSLEKLRQRATVVVRAADVANEADNEAVLAYLRRSMPPLKGVIHAAAVFEDAVLANLTGNQFERVLRPKVTGAWLLSRATRELDLDFFVLFSSVLSLWGGLGQGAYTAANSFLDALAALRRSAGLPATVFNWGPWGDVGLTERWGRAGISLWKQRGTSPLSAEVALDILLRFLDGELTQLAVCDTRWPDFLTQFSEAPPLFRELVPASRDAVGAAEIGETPERLIEVVRSHVGQVLGMESAVPVSQPLNELGLDSLLAVNLANRLRQALKVPVPTALLLKGPSIVGLVEELFGGASAPAATHQTDESSTARVEGDGWLMFHHPNPGATTRLFCFPFAGGGAATFRSWVPHLDPRIELVAIEPPGRQTRLDEPPIRTMATFVGRLVPALLPFLDKPFAVYGHCLGALTLFETVRTLMRAHRRTPVHLFVSGARPPDELHRHQDFETKLLAKLLTIPGYSVFEPVHRQPDEVFAEAMLQFNVLATESLLGDPELRRLLLPVIRAEFEMSSKYRYTAETPWDVPLTCLSGTRDAYVSPENARSWSRFTTRRFQLFMVDTEHFLIVDDDHFLIRVVNRELANPL